MRLTDEHIESALREIRLALLEADVNFQVVKAFIDRVRDKATDQTVLKSLTPVQQVVKIVRDELLALFGDAQGGLTKDAPTPRVVLLLGLQGSGKTTTSGKLGRWLKKQGKHPLMVSTDVRRPAAIQQLAVVGEQAEVKVFAPETMDPVARASGALAEAKAKGFDTVIVDTAGRLHIDDELMDELQAIKEAVRPSDLLYVADSMTGQDAIKSAGEFNRRVGVTGVVLTKLDGDARGGAALSVVSVVGVPVAFIGSGETLEDLELFHPDRIVSRMLGMGDVLSLIEKAEQALDEGEAEKLEEKLRKNQFTLDDFKSQLKTIRRMGPLESVLGMIPGMGQMKELAQNKPDEKQLGRVEAIISSMTAEERRNDSIINGSPPQADCRGQRHFRRGREPAAEAVHRDAASAQDDRTGWGSGHARHEKHAGHEEHAADGAGHAGFCAGRHGEEAEKGRALGAHEVTVGFGLSILRLWAQPRAQRSKAERLRPKTRRPETEMLVIRMRRVGTTKKPYFRVVVTEAKSARESSFVENVGTYNPRSKPAKVEIDKERLQHWLKKGAQPSDSVRTLIKKHLTRDLSAPVAAPAGADARHSDVGRGGQHARERPGQSCARRRRGRGACAGRQAGLGEGPRVVAPRHDGAGVEDRTGRHGQDHRASGADGGGAANAGRGYRRASWCSRAVGYTGLTEFPSPKAQRPVTPNCPTPNLGVLGDWELGVIGGWGLGVGS